MCAVSRLPSIACTQLQVVSCLAAMNSSASRPSVPKSRNGVMVSARPQVGPDDPARLVHRVGPHPDLLAERGGLARHVHAPAVHVERPPVVDAAERRVLVAAEVQRRAPVRAVLLHQADPPGGVAERHQVLAEQPHPGRRAARARGSPPSGRPGSSTGAAGSPISVPGPTRVRISFSSARSTAHLRLARRRPHPHGPAFSPSHRANNGVNYQIHLSALFRAVMRHWSGMVKHASVRAEH